jgi:hypothetical protein
MPNEALLVHTLVKLADSLVDDFDVVELLSLLADRCVEVLGVSAAGVMLVAPEGDLRVVRHLASRCGWWSSSSSRPKKAPASTASPAVKLYSTRI